MTARRGAATLALAGLAVLAVLAAVLLAGARTLPGDTALLDLAAAVREKQAVDLVRVLTDLGSWPVAATIVVATGLVLVVRGRSAELGCLLVAAAVLFLSVHAIKAGVGRARPPDPLAGAAGRSYPSGHAAYSTVWIVAALVLAREAPGQIRPLVHKHPARRRARAALIVGGVAVAAFVGASRVYLRVHCPSDVIGGWALGAATLGAAAVAGLTVAHIRNNRQGA